MLIAPRRDDEFAALGFLTKLSVLHTGPDVEFDALVRPESIA
jgi:hypothetical protein